MDSRVNDTMRKKHFKGKNKNGQEEMKIQLREAGITEDGLTEEEMQQLLQAVDVSKLRTRTPINENSSQANVYEAPSSLLSSYDHNRSESSTFSSKKFNESSMNDDKTPFSMNQESRNYSSVLLNKIENWRIDPLKSKKLDNDVPLFSHKRPSTTPRHRFKMINEVPVIPNEMRNKQRAILDEATELYYRYMQKPIIDEVQWGTPIKEGTDNGSLDKFPISSNKKFKNVPEEYNSSRVAKEFSLRPRNSIKKGSYAISDDEEKEEMFYNKKKENSNRKQNFRKNDLMKPRNNQNSDGNQKRNDDGSNIVHDDKYKISSDETSKKRRSATPDYPEPSYHNQTVSSKKVNSYDVIVEVHNEAEKHNMNLNRSNSVECENIRPIKKLNESLNEEEIERQLITDDEDEEEKIVPLSPELPLSKRLRLSQSMLQNNRLKEENEKRKVNEELRLAVRKEINEKQERAKQRIEDKATKTRQLEMEKKETEEKEKMYRNNFSRNRKWLARTELESDELPKDEIILDTNNQFLEPAHALPEAHNKSAKKEKNQIKEIQCPICGKNFPADQVETHAGYCEAYVDDDQNDSNYSTDFQQLECVQCENFSTNDKKAYEQHEYDCNALTFKTDNRGKKYSETTDTKAPALMAKIHTKKRKR